MMVKMSENIPRRMKRFYRNGETPTEYEVKSELTNRALEEVDSFREKHSRYPKSEELDDISSNVFTQLKDDIRDNAKNQDEEEMDFDGLDNIVEQNRKERGTSLLEERKNRRKNIEENNLEIESPEIENEEEISNEQEISAPVEKRIEENSDNRSTANLFSDNEEMPNFGNLDEGNEMGDIASLNELSSLENELDDESDIDLVDKDIDTEINACPNCKNKTEQITYCSNCGLAFCDHCAKKIEIQELSNKYTCPKCGNEFTKRKI